MICSLLFGMLLRLPIGRSSRPGTAEPERADSGSKVRGRRLPAGASRMPAKFLGYVEARDEKAAIEPPVEEFNVPAAFR